MKKQWVKNLLFFLAGVVTTLVVLTIIICLPPIGSTGTTDYYNLESGKTISVITHFPTYQQEEENSCGPATARMILKYYGIERAESDIYEDVKYDKESGIFLENLRYAFPESWYYNYHESNREELGNIIYPLITNSIKEEIPFIISANNHIYTIIGIYNMGTDEEFDDYLIIADSDDIRDHIKDGYRIINYRDFLDQLWNYEFYEYSYLQISPNPFTIFYEFSEGKGYSKTCEQLNKY